MWETRTSESSNKIRTISQSRQKAHGTSLWIIKSTNYKARIKFQPNNIQIHLHCLIHNLNNPQRSDLNAYATLTKVENVCNKWLTKFQNTPPSKPNPVEPKYAPISILIHFGRGGPHTIGKPTKRDNVSPSPWGITRSTIQRTSSACEHIDANSPLWQLTRPNKLFLRQTVPLIHDGQFYD